MLVTNRLGASESLDRARLARLCAATLFHFVAMGMFMSAIPLYVHDVLGGSRAVVGVATAAFFPAAVLARPFIGVALDRIGRRPALLAATSLAAVLSVLYFAAGSVWAIVVLSVVRGGVGAAFYTGAATMATDMSPPGRRAETVTLFSLFLYIGFAAGPALGEWLATQIGFGSVWVTASVLSVVAFAITISLPETLSDTPDDVVHPRFGLHGAALGPGLVVMCAATGYTAITAFSPLYARSIGLGSSAGLYITFSLTILAIRLLSRRWADRHGRVSVALPGIIGATVGMTALAAFQFPWAAYLGVAAYSAGFAVLFPALLALTADRVGDHERGAALATFTVFFDIGGGVGTYLVGLIADSYGFGVAYGLPAVLCAGAALAFGTRVLLRQRPGTEPRLPSPVSPDP
jgi:MFS family permease